MMRRRDAAGNVSDLPELDLASLDADEQLYLRVMLGLTETGNMFHGRFVEVHVGRILGADVPDTGTNAWDLFVPDPTPITIEVKACPVGGTYRVTSKGADVWVFVTFSDKAVRPRNFSYVVASVNELHELSQSRMGQSRVFEAFGPPIGEAELLDAVRLAARRASN
jgi:hypothetical protein